MPDAMTTTDTHIRWSLVRIVDNTRRVLLSYLKSRFEVPILGMTFNAKAFLPMRVSASAQLNEAVRAQ